MIIGTAGHVDHGKTTLVKALTGIDTARLPEEKRRGITLELGFAHLTLDDGTEAGVVDVPGHERFVKAMASGAGGVDVAVLVVSADEGVMPQTREHLDICRLLGVQAGVVALTKSDLLHGLGTGWLELVKADLAVLTAGTFLEGAKVVPCSARDGHGIPALKAAITEAAHAVPTRPTEGPLFLPVDRAFSIKGFGTVVTGPLLSGQVQLEDAVSLLPGRPGPYRIRTLQVHGKPTQKVSAGQRVAINLPGIEAEEISRGMVLCRHDELPLSRMLDVELTLLPTVEKPLSSRRKLLLHLGTLQVDCTVALLDVEALAPGESCFAQLRLGTPVVALPEQRFILRGSRALPGRGATLAGGRILALSSPKRRKGAAEVLRPLVEGDLEARLAWLLRQAGYRGLTLRELFARAGVGLKALSRTLDLMGAKGGALLIDKERRLYLSQDVFQGMLSRALALIQTFHEDFPIREGLAREELRQRLSVELEPKLLSRLVQALVEGGRVEASGETLRLKGRGRTLTLDEEGTRSKVLTELSSAGLGPPRTVELAEKIGIAVLQVQELLKVAVSEGQVVRVSEELYFDKRVIDSLRERLVAYLQSHQEISTQAFKELVGQSRKFVIPLSEFFDREKVTLRVGEKRLLRKGRGA